jgi:hypothetical protein
MTKDRRPEADHQNTLRKKKPHPRVRLFSLRNNRLLLLRRLLNRIRIGLHSLLLLLLLLQL